MGSERVCHKTVLLKVAEQPPRTRVAPEIHLVCGTRDWLSLKPLQRIRLKKGAYVVQMSGQVVQSFVDLYSPIQVQTVETFDDRRSESNLRRYSSVSAG